MRRSWVIDAVCLVGALFLAFLLTVEVYQRSTELPGSRTPTSQPEGTKRVGAENGEPRKEATCRTTPGEGQPSMSHEDCAFIASQIQVLATTTEPENHSGLATPSADFRPGSDMPPDVRQLKPLPESVVQRLPALRGYQYFLSGQDIVVVGPAAKIAFVVDVKVRPR
jgi:hypothetical protein